MVQQSMKSVLTASNPKGFEYSAVFFFLTVLLEETCTNVGTL